MKLHHTTRRSGEFAYGALMLVPLAMLPVGVWLLDTGVFRPGVCGFKQFLGVPCLTCGATRATVHLFHGDLLGALKFQPLITLIYFALLVWALVSLGALVFGRSVSLELEESDELWLKLGIVGLPTLNWLYLWWAGI